MSENNTDSSPSSAAAANATAAMQPAGEAVAAEPFHLESILGRGFAIFGRSFFPLMALTLLMFLPWIAVDAASQRELANAGRPVFGGLQWLSMLLSLTSMPLAMGACVAGVADAVAGRSISIAGSLAVVFRRGHIVIVAAFLQALLMGIGTAMCIVPGFIMMTLFWVTIPVVLVEQANPIAALQRSASLTTGHRWAIFLLGVLQFVANIGVTAVLRAVHLPFAVQTGLTSLCCVLVAAVTSTLAMLAYVDLRSEKEGGTFDLDAALQTSRASS